MTDSDRNHRFGAQHPQGNGGQPQPSSKETHPETADFEAPPTQQRPVQPQGFPQNTGDGQNYVQSGERNYSNPFSPAGARSQYGHQQQFHTHHVPAQSGNSQNQQQDAAYAAGYPQESGGSRSSSNSGKFVLIAVLILAVVLVIAALAYIFFFKHADSGSQAGSPLTTAHFTEQNENAQDDTSGAEASEETTEQPTTTSQSHKRPEYPDLPAGAIPANAAARNNEPGGNFNSVYRGTEVTTEPFANAVRDEYVKHYVDTHEFDATIKAYSPITKISYTMDCSDNGEFVTCTGGNNAVVYIL